MKSKSNTEKEMREEKVPWPKTEAELNEYIDSLAPKPLLIACHTEVQLQIFCDNHQIKRRDVHRIKMERDVRARRAQTIYLLPGSCEGTEPGLIQYLEISGWKTVSITEEQVLKGTFSFNQ